MPFSRLRFLCCFTALTLLVGERVALSTDLLSKTHFKFREPTPAGYRVEAQTRLKTAGPAAGQKEWLQAWPDNPSSKPVELGSRVVLHLQNPADLESVLKGHALQLARTVSAQVFILQAPDAWTALSEAEILAADARVTACYPVTRRPKQLAGPYAPRPNDPFFFRADQTADYWQAYLENRDTNGVPLGADLNVREAWTSSRGDGVLVGIADDGVELDHPDLAARTEGAPHFNFLTSEVNGLPSGSSSFHATAVAGLIAATSNNKRGISGVAPQARLASWVIFGPTDNVASEEGLMDMFQYQSNLVSVENHSWGKVGYDQVRLSSLEDLAISNAVHLGRGGLGVVIVRAGGNGREMGNDANEDGYVADPRVIGVAAARLDGRAARYSCPGACLLVAALSGDVSSAADPCLSDSPNLVSTDRQGSSGYNRNTGSDGAGDYTFGANGFSGTSAATPQITGVVALILAANPNLTYRDVQQVLIHSARPYDFTDPTLVTNSAGFRVSHNVGFGIPDAGMAVALARGWTNRPAPVTLTYAATNAAAIPDLGLRLQVDGTDLPANLQSIAALAGDGPDPETRNRLLPLVDVGSATNAITTDLRGKMALIQRGANFFCEKVAFAAQAGAELAVVYNNKDADVRIMMAETDLSPIPSIFISQNDGEALRDFLAAQPATRARMDLQSTNYTFQVDDSLLCEFVGVRIDSNHTGRGDLHIVLTSPSGTRSTLQRANQDTGAGPSDWTYYSVQHFYESSFGQWTLRISDEDDKGTGSIKSASLILTGVRLTDSDHDGLDDAWEIQHFGDLRFGPLDDPDGDGYSNAREQIMGTDPNEAPKLVQVDLSVWDSRLARLSWSSNTNTVYRVEFGQETVAPLTIATNIPGRFRQTEWFLPYTNLQHQFFRIEALPKGN